MPRYALFAFTICFLTLIPIIRAVPTFDKVDCPNATNATVSTYAQNSTYQTNLNTLLSALSSHSTVSSGFYKSDVGTIQPDVAYGFFLCRGDVSAAVCEDCVGFASRDVVARCPTLKRVTIWYDECMLRYSNRTIFFNVEEETAFYSWNGDNVTNVTRFNEVFPEPPHHIILSVHLRRLAPLLETPPPPSPGAFSLEILQNFIGKFTSLNN
ncbi:hypothetical protein Vadar_014898 [Vaccinium darrowii]|uniref:Uncharacterized protein n=1 Tax=Vaccinium darrowii TaxID=229202 RepID=A0ACB7X9X9_9ERIC|nr:hypothetical protein Vadar_014898 [Vaccinium darrowii]